jgi:hypothetical protein
MASGIKFDCFMQDLGIVTAAAKKHDFTVDTLKWVLVSAIPTASMTVLADLAEITAGHGYPAGGLAISSLTWTRSGTVWSLSGGDVTLVPSGGTVGPLVAAVLVNSSQTGSPLIQWHEYGASLTRAVGETLRVHPGSTILQVGGP